MYRVKQAFVFCTKIAVLWGLVVAIILGLGARPLAGLFNDQPEVITLAARFLWIVPISYGLYGLAMTVISMFNALNRPLKSVFIICIRLFVLSIPLAWIGSEWWDVTGIFIGISVANIIIGIIAYLMAHKFFKVMPGLKEQKITE